MPRKMLAATFLLMTIIALAHIFISDLDDALAVGLDVITVASLFAGLLMIAAWAGWFLIFSGWKWWARLCSAAVLFAIPAGLFLLFRPVNGGDANIVRFEPVWATKPPALETSVPDIKSNVDLATETSFDFPRFLGPGQNGVVTTGIRIDAENFSKASVLWKQPVGQGWAGFVAVNGFAVTMEQRGDKECVTCCRIDTGELQWIYQHAARHKDAMNLGRVGPRSTPTIHDGKVYAVGAVGNFVCLNGADGTVVWQQNLNPLLGIELTEGTDADGFTFQHEKNTTLSWARAASPLIVNDTVIIPGGGPAQGEKHTLLAFDLATGELRWKGGSEMIAYGSPVLATVAGREQIMLVTENKIMSFDPANGNVLWEHPRPGQSDGAANTSQVTVVSQNQLLTSKGYPDGGGELLELSDDGGKLTVRSVWKNPAVLKTKLTSPVIHDGHAFSFSNGFLECTNLADGQRLWKRRGRFGHGQMLLVDQMLLVHSEEGVLYLVEASTKDYNELGSLPTVSGVCWNTLCLYGSKLLVRSELEAACVQLPAVEDSQVAQH